MKGMKGFKTTKIAAKRGKIHMSDEILSGTGIAFTMADPDDPTKFKAELVLSSAAQAIVDSDEFKEMLSDGLVHSEVTMGQMGATIMQALEEVAKMEGCVAVRDILGTEAKVKHLDVTVDAEAAEALRLKLKDIAQRQFDQDVKNGLIDADEDFNEYLMNHNPDEEHTLEAMEAIDEFLASRSTDDDDDDDPFKGIDMSKSH